MYGYEPERMRPGGCRDTFTLMRVAFEVLVPIVGAGIGALGYVALTFWLFTVSAYLGLIPIALAGFALWLVARRDRRLQREKEAESRWGD